MARFRFLIFGLSSTALVLLGASSLPAAAPRVIKITGTDNMQYDVKTIEAKPGEKLKVVLTTISTMSKEQMAHNFVLLAKGTNADMFVKEASMAKDKGYIPDSGKKSILAMTGLAGKGETVEVTFDAPKKPGEYLYICTFPGHYLEGMKGKLIVK
jgi:azurin